MSLDVTLTAVRTVDVYAAHITHNLNKMAMAAGIYMHVWRPEEIGITKARDLITPIATALGRLKARPDLFQSYNPENGWGSYAVFVEWLEKYLHACIDNPDADVSVSR